jgi:small-conductance mechanosensitive channel
MTYDGAEHSRQALQRAQEQDQLNRLTNSGRYQGGPTDGRHFGLGSITIGVCVTLFLWIPLQAVGIHPFWSLPAGAFSMFLTGVFANWSASLAAKRSGSRVRSPVRFFAVLGAIVCAGLGIWFALSEGDLPVVRGAITFGAIGAVLGLAFGVLVKILRSIRGRGAA